MSRTLIEGRRDDRRKVLILGGGVAGVEALLALNALASAQVVIEVVDPRSAFVFRPLSVAEPFELAEMRSISLADIAAEHGARHRRDVVAAVDPARAVVRTAAEAEIEYDFLLIAVGARASEALPGALTFRGPPDIEAFRKLLAELENGYVKHVVFVVPRVVRWPLPIYELPLMTAAHLAARDVGGVEITVVTHEQGPLDIFGPTASDDVRALLEQAGVRLLTTSFPASVEDGRLVLQSGDVLHADRVVALPKLEVPRLPGVPQGPLGFIPTDFFGRVVGLENVYAAGDASWYPIKLGGSAAEQADAAATAIAAAAGAPVEPSPFHPVLRGILLGGSQPLHLRFEAATGGSEASLHPLWWPPGKVAGRYLAPYLARRGDDDQPAPPLSDIDSTASEYAGVAEEDLEGGAELALAAADASANWGDFESALRWLAAAEQLNVVLQPEYAEKRQAWNQALEGQQKGR